MSRVDQFPGRLLAAGRVAAGLDVRALAAAANVSRGTITRLETASTILVFPRQRHGHVARAVWDRIEQALAARGVSLVPETPESGPGIRLVKQLKE